jgi:PhnB protein
LGDGLLDGFEAPPGEYEKPQSFCVMFRPKHSVEADRIFSALAEEGAVQMPINGHLLGAPVRMVVDQFGML